MKFDWIAGNPPWKQLDPDSDGGRDKPALKWVEENHKTRPIGRNQAAEAFAWKATDHLAPEGLIGFLLPAMSLFKDDSRDFRKNFFRKLRVWGIANFANLAEVLFAGRSRVPAAAFFYSPWPGDGPTDDADILYFAPLVANQEANRPVDIGRRKETWNIVVNASEVRAVPLQEAVEGDQLTWKLGMWGSPRDVRLIEALKKSLDSLEGFAKKNGLALNVGVQLRAEGTEGAEFVEALVDKNVLRTAPLRNLGLIFSFPDDALEKIPKSRAYVRTQGGKGGLIRIRPRAEVAADRHEVDGPDRAAVECESSGGALRPADRTITVCTDLSWSPLNPVPEPRVSRAGPSDVAFHLASVTNGQAEQEGPTGRTLRLVPSRRTKDGSFLTALVEEGLLTRVTGSAGAPFEGSARPSSVSTSTN